MDLQNNLYLLLALIILAAGLFVAYPYFAQKPTHLSCVNQQCQVAEGAGANECKTFADCVLATALPSPAASPIDLQKQCDIQLSAALSAFDVNSCDQLSCPEKKAYCKDLIYSSLAERTKTLSFCEKISDSQRKAYCTAVISLNPWYCNQLTFSPFKDGCLQRVSRVTKNATTCEGIASQVTKNSCLNALK